MADEGGLSLTSQAPPNLRLVYLIEAVADAGVPRSATELARALDLPKPTVHRLLRTAEAEGLIERDIDGRSFVPGHRLRRLAAHTLSSERLRAERLSILKGLADEVGETCNIVVPGDGAMIYLERVETRWPLRIQLPIGSEVPLNCTATGKMYLSSLRSEKLQRVLSSVTLPKNTARSLVEPEALIEEVARIRARGYSTDDEEFMVGMVAIAVPITDESGRLMSALSIHAPVLRHTLADLAQYLDRMQEVARQLEALAREWGSWSAAERAGD